MRTKEETVRLCLQFFKTTDDVRTLVRLCPDKTISNALYLWWRQGRDASPANLDGIRIIDVTDDDGDDDYTGQDVIRLGPDSKGYYYHIDRESNEIIKRTRSVVPKQDDKAKVILDETVWYSVVTKINERFNNLNRMKDRHILEEEICGIASRNTDKNMRMYLTVLSILGFLEPTSVDAILHARSGVSQSEEKKELFIAALYDLPFGIRRPVNTDIAAVRKVLDDRLFKLDAVKEQIIEYITLMIHSRMQGMPVPLLLVGPPGVGKTSIAKAIASALGLPFHSFHLGGASDNAVFRGHHSSWSESTPGGIIRMLISAESENLVCLMDEIDKSGASAHGVIADIVSELIDPAQSQRWTDNYMGFPTDLSRVLYILTANDRERIPGYLLDRCEVIEIRQYTPEERAHIIEHHLLVEVCVENFLRIQVEIEKDMVEKMSLIPSLREVKRVLRSSIAKVLSKLRVDEVSSIRLDADSVVIKSTSTKPGIGFMPAAKN